MYKRISFFLLSLFLVAIVTELKADSVKVSGRHIILNGKYYIIKGICYNPVPKGSSQRSFENLTQDLALMKEAGINTIRVYSPVTDTAVLDQIDAAGIKIIMAFGYNQGGKNDILSGSFINYIKNYKDHNAILFWELGNEYNYHPEWFEGDIKNWYSVLEDAAKLIHKTDPNHPVSTAHGELPDEIARTLCPSIDIWGINVYRWDNPEGVFNDWIAVSTKPMYLSEAGADSYMTVKRDAYEAGENQKAQADATFNILNDVFSYQDICSGVTLFAFSDEWWKAGNNNTQDPGGWAPNSSGVPYDGTPNEEYWGIVDINRVKKMAYKIVKAKYNSVPN